MSELQTDLEAIAAKTLEQLEHLPAGDSITAWELKLKVKAALSPLYMALGMLQERGRIRIQPDGLTYRVRPASANASQPVVGVPLQIPAPASK